MFKGSKVQSLGVQQPTKPNAALQHDPSANRLPVLAIVGRPNVGKSTLFNRLVKERKAIVHDQPGVTRDRNYGFAEWSDKKFILIDTGGLDVEAQEGLDERVQEQSRNAIAEADVILFLFDGKNGNAFVGFVMVVGRTVQLGCLRSMESHHHLPTGWVKHRVAPSVGAG